MMATAPSYFRSTDFDFELPESLIAQQPAPERDQSRLMLLQKDALSHHQFSALPELIEQVVGQGTLLVLNDTRVLPARLRARKLHSGSGELGGQVELLLCEPVHAPGAVQPEVSGTAQHWRCMYRASKAMRPGMRLLLLRPGSELATEAAGATMDAGDLRVATVLSNEGDGYVTVALPAASEAELLTLLTQLGEVPLPPYIHRDAAAGAVLEPDAEARREVDRQRYQTVFAQVPGSVAAPTAGLHFTPQVLAALSARGIEQARVTLHVGPGTFLPMRTDDPSQHVMHAERYHVPPETAAAIARAKAEGRKVLAVGTTVVRTLESATLAGQHVPQSGWGETQLFIYPRGPGAPQHRFKVVDALLTNFHLPRSTLLMLVAALAGRQRVLAAYAQAVAQSYRFFSFGDAMLIPSQLPDPECAPASTREPERP